MKFELISDYVPTGDQPEAIRQLAEGVIRGDEAQILLGVTGSGKTFTIANVIQKIQRPVLVLSHNKTLAAQLYSEFKNFFPQNAVEYFVSYYDYYQPEAYIPVTNTYIEKDLSINDEIEKLRLSATSSLMSGRRDVIVVSSVSCIYGIGNPESFAENVIHLNVKAGVNRNDFLLSLVNCLYSRTENEISRAQFRVRGDVIDVFPAYSDICYRISFFGNDVESIASFDPVNGRKIENFESLNIYPANIFITSQSSMNRALEEIRSDLIIQSQYFNEIGKGLEAKRLEDRVSYDIEMMRELGYCSGIENYSRYFDRRNPGMRPFCLLDYFPDDFLLVVDESHVTIPQIRAMYGGDRSRKQVLVDFGFRLPSAMDNRPLKFDEFLGVINQTIYVSATPAEYELNHAEGVVVEQLIRPTGLLDPVIEVKPSLNQIDDLLNEIDFRIVNKERVLVTTLTKRMAEELSRYLVKMNVSCRYIHSEVDTLERVEILRDLRNGEFNVLVGVNLLREGLDLPEVSLVAILDADKEGFLRSERSLTQTAGRAARNLNAKVIMYADKITDSMRKTIEETVRRREKQIAYNEKHGITPTAIVKSVNNMLNFKSDKESGLSKSWAYYEGDVQKGLAAEPVIKYMSKEQIQKSIAKTKKAMETASKNLDFIEAARLRDEMFELQKMMKDK